MKFSETTFGSIVPEEMTNSEIREMCGYLYTAQQWSLPAIIVDTVGGGKATIEVNELSKYQEAYRIETGQIKL